MLTLVLILGILVLIISKIIYFKRRKAIQETKRKTKSLFWENIFPALLLILGICWANLYGTLSAYTNTIFSRWLCDGEVTTIYQRLENYEKTLDSQQDDVILEALKGRAELTRLCEKMIYPDYVLKLITDKLTK